MTREINGHIRMVVSDDGTRCAAECPHRDGGYGHCTAFDKPLVLDLGHGAYDRCPTCISAEQAAASSGHLDGGARALDASEALREARVQGMREALEIVHLSDAIMSPRSMCSIERGIDAAIEAVRKGER